jgi:hypothetical protein
VGYLLKERVFDVVILVDAPRRIADGETVVDPTIVSRLVGRRRREDPLADLTARELEVLGLGRGRPRDEPGLTPPRARCARLPADSHVGSSPPRTATRRIGLTSVAIAGRE